jgi:hypothetical protein
MPPRLGSRSRDLSKKDLTNLLVVFHAFQIFLSRILNPGQISVVRVVSQLYRPGYRMCCGSMRCLNPSLARALR